jgi:hypothetical protein
VPNNLGKFLHPRKKAAPAPKRTEDIRLLSPEQVQSRALSQALADKRQAKIYRKDKP